MFGHFGSFICGIFLGMMFMKRVRNVANAQGKSLEKIVFMIGAAGLVLYFGLMFTLFLTVVEPRYYGGKI